MKVVHVTAYYPPEYRFGGPPASINELCRSLIAAGVGVHVVTTTSGKSQPPTVEDGVVVTRAKRQSDIAFFALIDTPIKRALADADICHVHGLFNWPVWRATSLTTKSGRPLVVSPRGMLEPAALAHHRRRKQMVWRFEQSALTRAAAIVAATSQERDTIRQAGWDAVVLPNGIEPPDPIPPRGTMRARLHIPDDAAVIGFVGRLHPIKRLDLLVAAFDEIARQDSRAHLVIAGPDEVGMSASLAASLAHHKDRVHFLGPVENEARWQLLVDCDTLVLCSDSESYGRVVAEALVVGVPPVVTQTCPWEILEPQQIGRWVAQSAPAIASAVLDLLRDEQRRREMGVRARTYALAHLTWTGVTAGYISLYESVLHARAR